MFCQSKPLRLLLQASCKMECSPPLKSCMETATAPQLSADQAWAPLGPCSRATLSAPDSSFNLLQPLHQRALARRVGRNGKYMFERRVLLWSCVPMQIPKRSLLATIAAFVTSLSRAALPGQKTCPPINRVIVRPGAPNPNGN
jgi:hypothetical protein